KCTVACTASSQCVPSPPSLCVTGSCNGATGKCDFPALPDGTPTPGVTQTAGDCHVRICLGGIDTNTVDDSDVPPIPAGEAGCAEAECTKGAPRNPLHAVDSVCSTYMGNQPGHCDGAAHCVQCTADKDCPGTTDDCQHPSCTGAMCGTAFKPAGTATSGNPP